MSIDVNILFKDILTQSEALARTLIQDFTRDGMVALQTYLSTSRGDLERWTGELAQGEMTKDEFSQQIKSPITTALLAGLEETGLAAVTLDKFTNGVTDIVVAVAFNAAKGLIP